MLNLATKAVALQACAAGVDHIADTRHGQRSLGHIGGQHNATPAVSVKNAVLLGLREASKQGQHFSMAKQRLMTQVFAQVVRRLADLALTRQEHQNVATVVDVAPKFVHAVGNRAVQVVVA